MKLDADRIRTLRIERGWSQNDLADATELDVRTIQRIEATGAASLRSQRAIAAVLDLNIRDLDVRDLDTKQIAMAPCPHCQSDQVYKSDKPIDTTTIGGELLPKLASGRFSSAKVRAVVCASCGLVRFFADPPARLKLETSKHWTRVADVSDDPNGSRGEGG